MPPTNFYPLRDTTNSNLRDNHGAIRTTQSNMGGVKSYFGTRYVTSNANDTQTTPKTATRRPLSNAGGSTQANRNNTYQQRDGCPLGGTPKSSRFAHLTPQKPLFQRSLLRDIQPGEEAPLLTIVLDLDETLVYNRRADIPHAILRPYVLDVLAAMRSLPGVEIVMWTASTEETGSSVVKQLHAQGVVFDDVIYRNDDWFTEPVHTKDLRLLGRSMDRVVVFDNAPNCCKLNKGNAVLIEDFMGTLNQNDHSLVNMLYTIKSLVEGTSCGTPVSETLEALGGDGNYCYMANYPVPEAWAHVKPGDVAPIMYPPHGTFFKLHSSTTQRHTFRME